MTTEADRKAAQLRVEHPDWTWKQIAEAVEGPGDGATDREREETARRSALRDGYSVPPGAEPAPPVNERMLRAFHENRSKGMSRKDSAGDALHVLLEAAYNPDHPQHDQAVFDKDRWRQRFEGASGR